MRARCPHALAAKARVAAMAVLVLAAACTTTDDLAPASTSGGSATTSPRPAATVPLLTAPQLTTAVPETSLTATEVRLVSSEESDNALRILVDSAAADLVVTLTGVPTPNRVVMVCPATELERRVGMPGCVAPASGETVRVAHLPAYKGVEIVQVGAAGAGGAAGNSTVVGEVAVRYRAASREVRLRLPPLAPGEAGAGGPAFRMSPAGPGAYRASLSWAPGAAGTGTGTAELALLPAGTPTGAPVATAQGGPGTLLSGNLSPPAEATIRVRNTGPSTLTGVTITAALP